MPRLNNEMRDQIRISVMASTHRAAEVAALLEETRKLVRETLISQLPPGFLAATETLPPSWFSGCDGASIEAEDNPEMIVNHGGAYQNSHKIYCNRSTIRVDRFRVPANMSHYSSFPFDNLSREERKAGQGWAKVLAKQIKEAKCIWTKYSALEDEIKAFLLSVNTTEALLKAMPEYARHIPKAPAKQMPVAVIPTKLRARMTAAGFDTGAV